MLPRGPNGGPVFAEAAALGQRVSAGPFTRGRDMVIELEGINGQDVAVAIMPQAIEVTTGPEGDHLLARRCTVLRYRGISFDAALRAFEPEPLPPDDHMPPDEDGETVDGQIRAVRADLAKLISRAALDPQTTAAWDTLRDRAELLIRLLDGERRQLRAELAAAGAAVAAGIGGGEP